MKIDLANLRPSMLEIPEQIASLLDRLKRADTMENLVDEMKNLKEWPTLHGKSELVRWAPVLNRLDDILEMGARQTDHRLAVDTDTNVKKMVEVTLKFSAQVFENTTSRSAYGSVDRLLSLMDSSDPHIIIEVLLVFQVMGKRSRFLSNRLSPDLQKRLVEKLAALTECWGGRLRDVKLTDCIAASLSLLQPLFPLSFTNASGQSVHIPKPDDSMPLLLVVEETLKKFDGDEADRASLVARLRLLRRFDDQTHRVDWLIARLLAMSTLLAVYSRCGSDELAAMVPQLPPPGFIEQTCSLLHVDDTVHERVDMIKSEALRTLTAICSNETKPHRIDSSAIRRRLLTIMEQLGATSYHGFLATYVRDCVEDLKKGLIGKPGHPSVGLCTALFSLLYHMASLDHPRRTPGASQETLISAGITQTMLSVISYHDLPPEYTSFVTRCVRVIDVVSALDVQGFISHKGLETCVNRLNYEVDECKKEHPYMIDVTDDDETKPVPSTYIRTPKQTTFCHHQRGALIKSLLNFLKRVINERDFVEQVRHLMEYGLPDALRHIFSNMEYYSSALFHYSMQLVQNFVYQEPAQLTMLQNHHVPYTLLMAVLRKDVDPTRDIITTMSQVFSALCLNDRGMSQFQKFKPFDEMLRIVLTAKYINTMKRRRGGDLMDDCSYNVGTTLDDLLRQQVALRELCLDSFIDTLKRLVKLGTEPAPPGIKIVMTLQKHPRGYLGTFGADYLMRDVTMSRGDSVGVMSPREMEEEEGSDEDEIDPASVESGESMDASTSSPAAPEPTTMSVEEKRARDTFEMTTLDSTGQRVLPLGDYMCILTRIIEQVLMAAAPVSDMTEGLVSRGGVPLLLQSMSLPNLQMELAASAYPSVVATIIRQAVGGQPNMQPRHQAPGAAPVREEVMAQMVEWATEALGPVAQLANTEEGREGGSLLAKMATADSEADYSRLAGMTANVLNVTAMLVGVTKCAAVLSSHRDNDLRSKVITMWTEEGAELHSMLHRIYSVFSWEQSVMTCLRTAHKKARVGAAKEMVEEERSRSSSVSVDPSVAPARDSDSTRALVGEDPDTSDTSIESVDVEMMPSTSNAGDEGALKASQECKAVAAESIGLTREENNFYLAIMKKADFCKQFCKALKSVQELLGYFSRVCIGNTTRARRGGAYDAALPYNLTKNATKLVTVIFREYRTDLEFAPIAVKAGSPVVAMYLADLLSTLQPLLMDDKKSQYHHLVARFYSSGCYKAVFGILTDFLVPALMEKKPNFGCELLFLEWCRLVSVLSNRQGLVGSRFKMVEAQAKLFPVDKYYVLLQTDIFNALHSLVPVLQASNSAVAAKQTLTEMLFRLLSEVTRNLTELRDEEIEQNGTASGERALSDADANAVQRLMDMGFERAACLQALAETTSVSEALDVLTAERDLAGGAVGGAGAAALGNRFAMLADAEEGEWMNMMMGMNNMVALEDEEAAEGGFLARAIRGHRDVPDGAAVLALEHMAQRARLAAAAGDEVPGGGAGPAAAAAAAAEETAGPSNQPEAEKLETKEVKLEWDSVVERTTQEWIPLMLQLSIRKKKLPTENRVIYHVADLTNSIWRFASDEWKREKLLKETLREEIMTRIAELRLNPKEENSFEIGTRLHYACLIFESMAADYVKVLSSDGASIVTTLLDLIDFVAGSMDLSEYTVSTVINPTLLWLEMYDKYTHYVRRLEVYAKCESPLSFSYYSYEDRYNASRGKWQVYSAAACKKMTKAFLAGEQSVAVRNGRRDFIVDLVDLIQTQEGSAERVNVMVMMAESDVARIDVEEFLAMEKRPIYSEVEMAKMVNVLVAFLSKCHIASYGAHSALELLVRLTRDETVAAHFVQNKGLEAMMKVRGQSVRYSEALFTQLVRQCVEDESLMTKVFDQMIRQSFTVGIKPAVSGRWQSAPFTKDALQILSYVAHSATRSPLHYYNSLMKYMKLDKNGLIVTEQPKPADPTIKVSATPAGAAAAATVAKPDEVPSTPVSKTAAPSIPATPSTVSGEEEKEKKESYVYTGPGLAIVEMLLQEALVGDWSMATPTTVQPDQTKKTGVVFRLFSKSTLLYTLAELVRSYPFVATTLTELKDRESGASVMSMLMDKYSDPTIEKDTSNALHVLLATLSITPNPKAHDNILNDMKNCLIGFASAPESHTNVHLKINELALVLSSMMTSCPNAPAKKDAAAAAAAHGSTNSIVKLAVKKRILNELIRCVTRLVLSKRESIETVNTVIRAIDEMTKACNMTNPLAGLVPALATARGGGQFAATINEIFGNYTLETSNGAPQATLRRVDVGPNGDMTEAVVQIDVNGLDAAGLESVMERVNAAVDMATREVERRTREGQDPAGAVVQMQVAHVMGQPLLDDGAQQNDAAEAQAQAEIAAEMRSASSEDDDDEVPRDAEMMEHEEEDEERREGGAMMEEDDDDDGEEDMDDEHADYEDGYEDEHHEGDVLEEGDDDDDDDEDGEEDEDEEEDEEEAAREDERERAQHALASASAGGEEGEGERTGEDEDVSEVEGDEDDDPFGAFEHISYLERDAARIFMDIDNIRGGHAPPPGLLELGEGRWGRELLGREFSDLLYPGGVGGGPFGFDPYGAPRHIARWDQSPERTARASGGVHPLLQRPGSAYEGGVAADIGNSHIQMTRARLAERVGLRTGGALDTHRQRLHLIRQNAVRRNRDTTARTDENFRRLLDLTTAAGGRLGGVDHGGLHASWRPLTDPALDSLFGGPHYAHYGGGGASAAAGLAAEDNHARMTSRLLTESCPSTLDRFRESGRVLDDVHGHIMAAIVNSVVYHKFKKEEADARLRVEEEAKAKKEEADRLRQKEEQEKMKQRSTGPRVPRNVPAAPPADAVAAAADEDVDETQMEEDEGQGEEQPMAWREVLSPDGAVVALEPVAMDRQEETAAVEGQQPAGGDADESMDTTSPSAAVAAPVAGSAVDETGENSNGGNSSTGAVMGDETSQSGDVVAAAQSVGGQPQLISEEQVAAAAASAVAAAAAAAPAAPPAPEMQEVPEEYREILGCSQLPAGVDAAFLAALPDDMRAEVLRDHERQMRQQAVAAARAAVPPAAPAAAAVPTEGVAAAAAAPAPPAATGAAASAPGIEPLDPDFLSALPPELQAEIIEQHERAVRAANAAAAAAAAPPAPAQAVAAEVNDGAEVIRSLPPTLRAQVLADADDTVLAALPQEMQDEARRLRNERGAHVARIAAMGDRDYHRHPRMVVRAPGARLATGRAAAAAQPQSGVGQLAGSTMTAPVKGMQMLDRDALSALIIMFFADARLSQPRLQKTLRDLCTHKGTCDYLIYALLAILKQISENKHQEEEDETQSDSKSWTDTITVSGVGHNERVLKIDKDGGVSIHPMHAGTVAKNVTDLLVQIARSYPGHFIPHVLRKEAKPEAAAAAVTPPPFENFWHTVYSYTTSKPGSCAKEALLEHRVDSLECSPLATCMELLQTNTMKTTAGLNEKLLRLIYTIVQTLPDDTLARLRKEKEGAAMEGAEETPLCGQMKLVCALLTDGTLSTEALHDGRLLLVEAMRAMNFRTTATIYEMLVKRIELLGSQLQPQIEALLSELSAVPEGSGPSTSKQSKYDADLSREQRRRTEMERENMFHALHSIRNDQRPAAVMSSCAELQVPSVRALQEKAGVQAALLGALQTTCKTRDTLGLLMADRKRARTETAQKKLDKAKKEYDEKKKKEQEAAAAATAAAAAAAAAVAPAACAVTFGDAEAAATTSESPAAPAPSVATTPAADTTGVEVDTAMPTIREPVENTTATTSTTEAAAADVPMAEPETVADPDPAPKLEDFLEPETAEPIPELKLSAQLQSLEGLWSVLSDCLQRLGRASDPHAILVLQPAAEAFFLVHAVTAEKAREAAAAREHAATAATTGGAPAPVAVAHSGSVDAAAVAAGDEDTTKLLQFAEKHRSVLNQVLRQNQASLQDGPFAILAACPKLLDFDVKRTHFRKQLGRMDDRQRYRRDDVPLRIRRAHIFSDSFRELFRLRGNEWKSRFYIMFEGEEGQDAGGLLREWFSVITREIFNPNYALFNTAPGDRSTYMINKASYINPEHLDYFKFVGRIIAKAIHDNKLLDCYFTRAFYKHILNLPVKYQDLESEDPEFYKSFDYLLNNPVETMGIDLTFTLEVEEFGVVSTRPLKEGGADLIVTDENKEEYVRLVCQMKMTSSIRRQLDAFLDGFYEVIPKQLIAMFNEQELELLISGLPDVDIDDLAANTEYRSYNKNSKEIQWFWRALRSFEPEDRAKFLQFVTGTSKVPLNGFAALEGMNGAQKFAIHQDSRTGNRLPAAHTCFNQLDLPAYDSYEKLREALLLAIRECTEGFGFA